MKCANYTILLKEIPWKISIVFAMTWCPMKCEGCHSEELWDANNWFELNKETIMSVLEKYKGYFDVVLFFWWEWNWMKFMDLLKFLKEKDYKIWLYTWMDVRPKHLEKYLDYLKYWKYTESLGWLESPTTNQRLIYIPEEKDITSEFWKDYTISLANKNPVILKTTID